MTAPATASEAPASTAAIARGSFDSMRMKLAPGMSVPPMIASVSGTVIV